MARKRTNLTVVSEADCKGCGACCRHVGHPMFHRGLPGQSPADQDWIDLPGHLKREINRYWEKLEAEYLAGDRDAVADYGEPCIWLQPDGTCKHYRFRPQVCRDFERGGEDCLAFRSGER